MAEKIKIKANAEVENVEVITYKGLLDMEMERLQSSAWRVYCDAGKMDKFIKTYGKTIATIVKGQNEIINKYVVQKTDGTPDIEVDENGFVTKANYKSPKSEALYGTEITKYLSKEVPFFI